MTRKDDLFLRFVIIDQLYKILVYLLNSTFSITFSKMADQGNPLIYRWCIQSVRILFKRNWWKRPLICYPRLKWLVGQLEPKKADSLAPMDWRLYSRHFDPMIDARPATASCWSLPVTVWHSATSAAEVESQAYRWDHLRSTSLFRDQHIQMPFVRRWETWPPIKLPAVLWC